MSDAPSPVDNLPDELWLRAPFTVEELATFERLDLGAFHELPEDAGVPWLDLVERSDVEVG